MSVSSDGSGGLSGFGGTEPIPKDIMRQAAMVKQLRMQGGEPGAEYDLQYGLDFVSHLLYSGQNRDPLLKQIHDLVSIRRGARGQSAPLSVADQMILAEVLFEQARESVLADRNRAAAQRRFSPVKFVERFGQSFPGVRGIQWFDSEEDVVERLTTLLSPPLLNSAIWWWRDGNNQIEEFTHKGGRNFLMDVYELNIRRIAAVNNSRYDREFVYVELNAMEPTGLYSTTADRIAEVKSGTGDWSYYWEEYGLVDPGHQITRAEYDDGAAKINGKLHKLGDKAHLRVRYVTPYNFLIAPQESPINDPNFDEQLTKYLDALLLKEGELELLSGAIQKLRKRLS